MPTIETILEYLTSFSDYSLPAEWLLIIKIVVIIFSLILVGFIIFTLLKSSWLKLYILDDLKEVVTFNFKPFGRRKIDKDWLKIKSRIESGLNSEYKLAIIEADNMTNEILKQMGRGHDGASLGEKLEKMTVAALSNLEELKEAHQIRNNIIHDPNYNLSLEETKKVLDIFEKTFVNLDVF